jgi:hypothetical protein
MNQNMPIVDDTCSICNSPSANLRVRGSSDETVQLSSSTTADSLPVPRSRRRRRPAEFRSTPINLPSVFQRVLAAAPFIIGSRFGIKNNHHLSKQFAAWTIRSLQCITRHATVAPFFCLSFTVLLFLFLLRLTSLCAPNCTQVTACISQRPVTYRTYYSNR